jgi:hypothetical protein
MVGTACACKPEEEPVMHVDFKAANVSQWHKGLVALVGIVSAFVLLGAASPSMAAPLDDVASRIGLVGPGTVSGGVRTWRNVRTLNLDSTNTETAASVTLEPVGDNAGGPQAFKLVITDYQAGRATTARAELTGRLQFSGPVTLDTLASAGAFVGTVKFSGIRSAATADVTSSISIAAVEATYQPGSNQKSFLQDLTMTDTVLTDSDAAGSGFKVGSLSVSGMNEVASGLMARLESDATSSDDSDETKPPSTASQEARAQRHALIGEFSRAAMAEVSLRGMEVTADDVKIEIDSFAVRNYGPERIERAEINGISFAFAGETAVRMGLAQLYLDAIDTRLIIASILAVDGDEAARALKVNSVLGDGPLDSGVDGFGFVGLTLEIDGIKGSWDQFRMQNRKAPDGFVTNWVMPVSTIRVVVEASSESLPIQQAHAFLVSMLGTNELSMSMAFGLSADKQNDILRLDEGKIVLQDSFDLEVGAGLGGLNALMATATLGEWLDVAALDARAAAAVDGSEQPTADGAGTGDGNEAEAQDAGEADSSTLAVASELPAYLKSASIIDANLTVRDRGLMDQVFAALATQQGGSVTEMRNQIAQAVEPDADADPKFAELMRKFARFVRSGGTLSITFAPATPLTLGQMEDANAFKPSDLRISWRDPRAK